MFPNVNIYGSSVFAENIFSNISISINNASTTLVVHILKFYHKRESEFYGKGLCIFCLLE